MRNELSCCGSTRVYRSHGRGFTKRALSLAGLKIRRCPAGRVGFTGLGGSVVLVEDVRRARAAGVGWGRSMEEIQLIRLALELARLRHRYRRPYLCRVMGMGVAVGCAAHWISSCAPAIRADRDSSGWARA
jgi:hypothetical protein